MIVLKLLYFLSFLSLCFAFNIKLRIGYCTYQCSNENSNGKETQDKITGYYWRDYKGDIPPDALPVGDDNQSPQTYYGQVIDLQNNGLYPVTIFSGQPYVYLAINDTVKKISDRIQILCTQEPNSISYINLSAGENTPANSGHYLIGGNIKIGKSDKPLYLTRISKDQCGMRYAGGVHTIGMNASFSTSTGVVQEVDSKEMPFLRYTKPASTMQSQNLKNKDNMYFIQHRYHFSAGDSLIPRFFIKKTIGSCSSTCTNIASGRTQSFSGDYYWKPNDVDQSDRLLISFDGKNISQYVGEVYVAIKNSNFIGRALDSRLDTVSIVQYTLPNLNTVLSSYDNLKVLCAKNTDNFKWMATNSSTVMKYKDKMLIPGIYSNGTPIAIGRGNKDGELLPGGIYLTENPKLRINSAHGVEDIENYEILLYEGSSDVSSMFSNGLGNIINFLQEALGIGFKLKF